MKAHERTIATVLILAILASVGFIVAYCANVGHFWEGVAIAVAAAALCATAVLWVRWMLPDERVEDERDDYPSSARARCVAAREARGAVSDVTRSGMLTRLLMGALGLFGIAAVVPVASLGPGPDDELFHTKWRRGSRLTRTDGTFVHVNELNVDSVVTVFPEGAIDDARSQVALIRLPSGVASDAAGYIAYSRVCTHAGCPVALYRAKKRQLMCPCHQSVFNVIQDGAVVSGPADHALPRLPLTVGSDGVLRADGDFPEPVGPGFWERGA